MRRWSGWGAPRCRCPMPNRWSAPRWRARTRASGRRACCWRRAACWRSGGGGEAMPEEIVMARLSDTLEQGTVARWLKREGDPVRKGEPLLEVETDKATMELPAYSDGVLQ